MIMITFLQAAQHAKFAYCALGKALNEIFLALHDTQVMRLDSL